MEALVYGCSQEFINHKGEPVDLNAQQLGDLVYVRTTVKSSGRILTELALSTDFQQVGK